MPLPKDQAWFRAKTYGWGWGWPRCWQGWVVMAGYVGAMLGVTPIAQADLRLFFACVVGLTLVLIAICWWKGEAPRWRWGGRE